MTIRLLRVLDSTAPALRLLTTPSRGRPGRATSTSAPGRPATPGRRRQTPTRLVSIQVSRSDSRTRRALRSEGATSIAGNEPASMKALTSLLVTPSRSATWRQVRSVDDEVEGDSIKTGEPPRDVQRTAVHLHSTSSTNSTLLTGHWHSAGRRRPPGRHQPQRRPTTEKRQLRTNGLH